MAGKYSSTSSGAYSTGNIMEEIDERYDIHIDSEKQMISDNRSYLENERRGIQDGLSEITEALNFGGLSKNRAEEMQMDYDEGVDDLNRIDEAINAHQALEQVLDRMDELEGSYRAGNISKEQLFEAMDNLNERRNDLKDTIEDTGYQFW